MKRPLIIITAVAMLTLTGCAGETSPTPTVTITETATAEPSETPMQTPEPEPSEPEDDIPRFEIGETGELLGMALTIRSVEVLDTIPTIDGSPLKAGEGEQYVLIKSDFTNNSKNLVDLSCSGMPDVYIQAWDTEEREMDPVYESSRLKSNPECNESLLQGQSHAWTFVYRTVKGAVPSHMALIDTATFNDGIVFYLD